MGVMGKQLGYIPVFTYKDIISCRKYSYQTEQFINPVKLCNYQNSMSHTVK